MTVPSPGEDASRAALLFAVDPPGLGGVRLRGAPGPERDAWLARLRGLLGPAAPMRRMPLHLGEDALLGGLDLAATLRAGHRVATTGLLAAAQGGVVVAAMAERMAPVTAAHLAARLDAAAAGIGVVALDEEIEEERPPAALLDRLAFAVVPGGPGGAIAADAAVPAARDRLAAVAAGDAVLETLCATAAALGIASLRPVLLALRAARAAAALAGRPEVAAEDAALAARLVLAHRATRLPAEPAAADAPDEPEPADAPHQPPPDPIPPPESQAADREGHDEPGRKPAGEQEMRELVLAAALAALPPGLMRSLTAAGPSLRSASRAGRSGVAMRRGRRGRPAGVRPGDPRSGLRLDLIATLRAAAPWQRLRGAAAIPAEAGRLQVRREDFRVVHLRQRAEATTIFLVDASGSSALNRLGEAKGAVELLLAECYVRRDRVAVLAFRGRDAQLLLPPTRSLVRARRSLATLPGGGGTPLAAGIEAGRMLAETVRRGGGTPGLVLLTDGRANVAWAGAARAEAVPQARAAARRVRLAGIGALLVDISPRPNPAARELAAEMAARYVPLPVANAAALAGAVRAAGIGGA